MDTIYKVIGKGDRLSAIVNDTKFSLHYGLGSTVESYPNSIGIMCFDDFMEAARFMDYINLFPEGRVGQIIEVEGHKQRGFTTMSLYGWEQNIERFYEDNYNATPLIRGTILFDEVDVLS